MLVNKKKKKKKKKFFLIIEVLQCYNNKLLVLGEDVLHKCVYKRIFFYSLILLKVLVVLKF